MHRFRSSASPVKGLTADILVCLSYHVHRVRESADGAPQIAVAHIAYDKPTVYDRYAPSQVVGFQDAFAALQAVEVTPGAAT
jgi:coenzyme A diphosphatase NUDT7